MTVKAAENRLSGGFPAPSTLREHMMECAGAGFSCRGSQLNSPQVSWYTYQLLLCRNNRTYTVGLGANKGHKTVAEMLYGFLG